MEKWGRWEREGGHGEVGERGGMGRWGEGSEDYNSLSPDKIRAKPPNDRPLS